MLSDPIVAAAMAGTAAIAPGMAPNPPPPGVIPRSVAIAKNWNQQGLKTQIRGVDISLWNHPGNRLLDFNAMSGVGVRFVFIKASDTVGSADRQAAGWWGVDKPAAKAAHMLVGGYQYVYPKDRRGARLVRDARTNARKASARVGVLQPGDLPVVLDLEYAPRRMGRQRLTRWAMEWLRTAEELTGRPPIVYTYSNFALTRLNANPGLTRFPLWQAEYGVGITEARPIPGWPKPPIWQFSGNGQIAGHRGSLMDLNVFSGTSEDLLKLAGLPSEAAPDYNLIPTTPAPAP